MIEHYDISFLKELLDIKGFNKTKFFERVGITRAYGNKLLNGDHCIRSYNLDRILECFNVSTYEELKLLVSNEVEKYHEKESKTNFDIEDLKKFLCEHHIKNVDFINYLGISKGHFYRLMSGDLVAKDKYKDKIIRLFESEELVERIFRRQLAVDHKEKSSYNISFLKGIIKDFDLNQSDIARYLGVSRQYVSLLLNGKENANEEHVKKLEMLFGVESLDELRDDEKGTQYAKK